MVFDNSQTEDEFWATYAAQSKADEIATFHFDNGKACDTNRTTGKRIYRYSDSSKLHAEMTFKEKPDADALSGVGPGDSYQLPYPAFSSPLEDMTFCGFDPSEFIIQDEGDGSGMTKLERLSKFHDMHIRSKALFTAWDATDVLRPPSSPIIRDVNAKRKWFS
ncbi:hypothetical protein MHU86_5398 [Fragilaria crotonensis]|nr:hypothetical protein MHU86_5398 [Fragilaria crotonensis]